MVSRVVLVIDKNINKKKRRQILINLLSLFEKVANQASPKLLKVIKDRMCRVLLNYNKNSKWRQ